MSIHELIEKHCIPYEPYREQQAKVYKAFAISLLEKIDEEADLELRLNAFAYRGIAVERAFDKALEELRK